MYLIEEQNPIKRTRTNQKATPLAPPRSDPPHATPPPLPAIPPATAHQPSNAASNHPPLPQRRPTHVAPPAVTASARLSPRKDARHPNGRTAAAAPPTSPARPAAPAPAHAVGSLSSNPTSLPLPSTAGSDAAGRSGTSPRLGSIPPPSSTTARQVLPFASSMFAPSRPTKDAWRCGMCSTKNVSASTRCRECHAIRKANDTPSATPAGSIAPHAHHPPTTWRCIFCAFDNKFVDSPEKCKICAGAIPTSQQQQHATLASVASETPTTATNTTHATAATPLAAATAAPDPSLSMSVGGTSKPPSLSLDSVPPFASATAAAAAAPLTTAERVKKAMSIIAEDAETAQPMEIDGASTNGGDGGRDPDADRARRWRAILDEPTSAAQNRTAAATTAPTNLVPTATAPGNVSNSGRVSVDLTAPKPPMVIKFTTGRGEIMRAAKRREVIIPTAEAIKEQARKAQEAKDEELARKLAAGDVDDNSPDGNAGPAPPTVPAKKRVARATNPRVASPSRSKASSTRASRLMKEEETGRTKVNSKANKARKRRRRDEDDEESDDESEWEDPSQFIEQEEKSHDDDDDTADEKDSVEMKVRSTRQHARGAIPPAAAADATLDVEQPVPLAQPADVAMVDVSARPSSPSHVTVVGAATGAVAGRAVPSFLVALNAARARKVKPTSVNMTGATKKGRKATTKTELLDEQPAGEEEKEKENEDVEEKQDEDVKPRAARKRSAPKSKSRKTSPAISKKRAAATSKAKPSRPRDPDSQEDDDWDGADPSFVDDADGAGVDVDDGDVSAPPPLVPPSTIPLEFVCTGVGAFDVARSIRASSHASAAGVSSVDKKSLEVTLRAALESSKAFLDGLGDAAATEIKQVVHDDVKPRKKRRINLADMIHDQSKLYELIQAPLSQTQSQDTAGAVGIGVEPQPALAPNDEDDLLANILEEEADSSRRVTDEPKEPPTRQSSRISRNASIAHEQTANRTASNTSAAAARPPPAAVAGGSAAISLNSDDELEAGLDDIFRAANDTADEAPPPPGEFKFKAEREAEEAEKQRREEETKRQEASLEMDLDEPESHDTASDAGDVDARVGSAPAAATGVADDAMYDDSPQQPPEWRRRLERRNSEDGRLTIAAQTRRKATTTTKPKKPRPQKKRPPTSNEAINAADSENVHPRPTPGVVVKRELHDHPLTRFTRVSESILPLFPDLTLVVGADFLQHFQDDVERTIDWLLQHPDRDERDRLLEGGCEEEKPDASEPTDVKRPLTAARGDQTNPLELSLEDAIDGMFTDPDDDGGVRAQKDEKDDDSVARPVTRQSSSVRRADSSRRHSGASNKSLLALSQDDVDEDFNPLDELFADSNARGEATKIAMPKPVTRSTTTATGAAAHGSKVSIDPLTDYYHSAAFEAKLSAPSRQRERERRARMAGKAVKATTIDEQNEEEHDGWHQHDGTKVEQQQSAHNDALECKYDDADDENRPPPMSVAGVDADAGVPLPPLSPLGAIYHFPSDVTGVPPSMLLDGDLAAGGPPAWSKRKPPPPPPTETPMPKVMRERQLRAEIHQLQELKKRQTRGIGLLSSTGVPSVSASPVSPVVAKSRLKVGRGPTVTPRAAADSKPVEPASVSVGHRVSRAAAAAAAAVSAASRADAISESARATAELNAHRQKMREQAEQQQDTNEDTPINVGTAAPVKFDPNDSSQPEFQYGRRTDIIVRSKRRKATT